MKDLKKLVRSVGERVAPVLQKARPYLHTADKIASLAVHMHKVTPLGAIGLASRGVNALTEALNNGPPCPTPWGTNTFLSCSQLVKAFADAGGTCEPRKSSDEDGEQYLCKLEDWTFTINHSNIFGPLAPAFWSRMCEVIDAFVPSVVEIRPPVSKARQPSRGLEAQPYTLTAHTNRQATEIAQATLPLLGDGRCILLDGKPGVGKTTLAQIIAREANLGRIVIVGNTLAGADYDSLMSSEEVSVARGFDTLPAGVIIVDDIDKVHINLAMLEKLRSSAKLVILTANNGQYDGVLDGALMRAGRVDEVFTIEPVEMPRVVPFDLLTDEEWTEVSQWPVAYVNEVRKRLTSRSHDVRLADLRQRLTRRTRSGDELL